MDPFTCIALVAVAVIVGMAIGAALMQWDMKRNHWIKDPNPNARRLIASRQGEDTEEVRESRTAARQFMADAEAGRTRDTTDYLRQRIKELKDQ